MKSLRILIVTHAPLTTQCGAGQMAINLADAFRNQGHDVSLWSIHPLPPETKWWQKLQPWKLIQQLQSRLHAYLETQKPFDLIDMPAGIGLITPQVCQATQAVVARSVQPPILYSVYNLYVPQSFSIKEMASSAKSYWSELTFLSFTLRDWARADYIFCLGNLELQWMQRWFPWWKQKLTTYVNALSPTDQKALAEVRANRQKPAGKGIRFLWIGRWAAHKGTTTLLEFIAKRSAYCPQDTFTIAGCGSEAEQDCCPELIQSGQLKIIPVFERNQLYSLLANHDVGLFTSKVEGWGLILNEMLEAGMTVFATSVGGVPDLLPVFKARLKPFPPPLELTSNLLVPSQIPEDYFRVFSWQNIAQKYIDVYRTKN